MWLKSVLRSLLLSCLVLALLTETPLANGAGPEKKQFEPTPGQSGKDVIWLPTAQTVVDTMLDLAKVTSDDFVIDLGSGDGRTVIAAAKRGARALGIEYEPAMVEFSRRRAEQEGVSDKAQFMKADLFESDFSQATVITMFLLPTINLQLRPKILDLKPGTRVASNSFDMGDWTPDESVPVSGNCQTYCTAHFWLVPAKVAGKWQTPQGEFRLDQKYQMVSGTLRNGESTTPLTDGKLKGEEITFTAGGTTHRGRVAGDTIEGVSVTGANETPWRATRATRG